MSWLSEFAGRAEDLLNKIDNNAASVLKTKNKKTFIPKHEEEVIDCIVTPTSQPNQHITTPPINSPVVAVKNKVENATYLNLDHSKEVVRDEQLMTYLNSPSVQVESIESDNYKKTSPVKLQTNGLESSELQRENDMLRNEVRSLNVEVSLLLRRIKSSEGDIVTSRTLLTKKESELNCLRKEISSLNQSAEEKGKNNDVSFLENERHKLNHKPRNEHTRELEEKLSDLQLQMHRREQQYKTDLANMRIQLNEVEESASLSEANHIKETTEYKYRIEEIRNEMEDYKIRARKSLANKEALIQELKSSSPSGSQSESLEVTQLRNELETLSAELEKCEGKVDIERRRADAVATQLERIREESMAEANSIRVSLRQETERRLAAEENCRHHAEELHKVHEDLSKQLAVMTERFGEKVNEVQSLRRQITQRGENKTNMSEMKVKNLTQALVQKQAALESATNERSQLRVELERMKSAHMQYSTQVLIRANTNDTDDAKAQVPAFMLESPFDTGVARKVKRAYSSLDAVSIRTGMFLRRYPLARIFFLFYGVCLHFWVCFVLFSNTPSPV